MQLIKRDLYLCFAVTALVFVCALAWGSPFVGTGSGAALTQGQQSQAQSTVFRGTVLRNGEQFLLRDTSGQIFRLDDTQHVQPYEGKAVRITGKLDAQARLIHVERIEPVSA